MSTTPPEGPEKPDRRGAPAGHFGNVAHEPTEASRARVRTLAQVFPEHSNEKIAIQLGISRSTLEKHYRHDLDLGRAQMLASVGAQMIQRALKGDDAVGEDGKPLAPGNIEAQKFILARLGQWTTKVEMTGKDGRPIETVDLSGMSKAELREYGRAAAIAAGLDPDEAVGPSIDD